MHYICKHANIPFSFFFVFLCPLPSSLSLRWCKDCLEEQRVHGWSANSRVTKLLFKCMNSSLGWKPKKKKKSPHLLFNSHFNEKRGKKTPRNAGFLHKKRVKQLMWKNESKMYAYILLCAVLYTYFFSSWLQNDNISDKYEYKIK